MTGAVIIEKPVQWFAEREFHKMVQHTQKIRRQIADKLFEGVWPFCGLGA